eukprot:122333-Amphidinium_carterae.1
MLSGRSTVVATCPTATVVPAVAEDILDDCRERLGLDDDGGTIELWHHSEKVSVDAGVEDWPGIEPKGEISEYQLVVTR